MFNFAGYCTGLFAGAVTAYDSEYFIHENARFSNNWARDNGGEETTKRHVHS